MPSCDCYDWQRFHLPCKHFCAVFHLYPDHGWDMLPASYRDSPFFRLDETVVGTSLETQEPAAADPADDDCDATPLSLAESQCLRSAKAAACREVLCELTNSTYLVGDTPTLESLYNKLLDLHADLIQSFRPGDWNSQTKLSTTFKGDRGDENGQDLVCYGRWYVTVWEATL